MVLVDQSRRVDALGPTGLFGIVRADLEVGVGRLGRVLPGQVRLFRWRTTRLLREAASARGASAFDIPRWIRRVLPLAVSFALTLACGLVSNDGPSPEGSLRIAPMPELSKPKKAEARRGGTPWAYVLPVDHGIREDQSGKGHFRAPRFHGEHNGLDLLAPVGTPTFSACAGRAVAGVSRSFGNWVRVICPVPDGYQASGGPRAYASFFYAHLDKLDLPPGDWQDVSREQIVGTVGKSGNARGEGVQPHLHLELIIQSNRRSAMDEHHLGADQTAVPAATYFAGALERECLSPLGFRPRSSELQRARRIDPFVALTCLGQNKPNFQRPPGDLRRSSFPWDRYYVAADFNVNLGPEDVLVHLR